MVLSLQISHCDNWVHRRKRGCWVFRHTSHLESLVTWFFSNKVFMSQIFLLRITCESEEALRTLREECSRTEPALGVQVRSKIYLNLELGVQWVVTCVG